MLCSQTGHALPPSFDSGHIFFQRNSHGHWSLAPLRRVAGKGLQIMVGLEADAATDEITCGNLFERVRNASRVRSSRLFKRACWDVLLRKRFWFCQTTRHTIRFLHQICQQIIDFGKSLDEEVILWERRINVWSKNHHTTSVLVPMKKCLDQSQ